MRWLSLQSILINRFVFHYFRLQILCWREIRHNPICNSGYETTDSHRISVCSKILPSAICCRCVETILFKFVAFLMVFDYSMPCKLDLFSSTIKVYLFLPHEVLNGKWKFFRGSFMVNIMSDLWLHSTLRTRM